MHGVDHSFDEQSYANLLASIPNVLADSVNTADYSGQRSYLRRLHLVTDDFQPALDSMRHFLIAGSPLLGSFHYKEGIGSLLSLVESTDLNWVRASRAMVSTICSAMF